MRSFWGITRWFVLRENNLAVYANLYYSSSLFLDLSLVFPLFTCEIFISFNPCGLLCVWQTAVIRHCFVSRSYKQKLTVIAHIMEVTELLLICFMWHWFKYCACVRIQYLKWMAINWLLVFAFFVCVCVCVCVCVHIQWCKYHETHLSTATSDPTPY